MSVTHFFRSVGFKPYATEKVAVATMPFFSLCFKTKATLLWYSGLI